MDIIYEDPLLYISLNLSDSDRAATPLQRSWMEGCCLFLLVSSFQHTETKLVYAF